MYPQITDGTVAWARRLLEYSADDPDGGRENVVNAFIAGGCDRPWSESLIELAIRNA